jgi:hypothetical protein
MSEQTSATQIPEIEQACVEEDRATEIHVAEIEQESAPLADEKILEVEQQTQDEEHHELKRPREENEDVPSPKKQKIDEEEILSQESQVVDNSQQDNQPEDLQQDTKNVDVEKTQAQLE